MTQTKLNSCLICLTCLRMSVVKVNRHGHHFIFEPSNYSRFRLNVNGAIRVLTGN